MIRKREHSCRKCVRRHIKSGDKKPGTRRREEEQEEGKSEVDLKT